MKVSAKLKNLRIAPRKSRLVANLIKGLDVQNALNQLEGTVKGASLPISKLIKSAVANGENNFGLEKENLVVSEAFANEGPTLKRFRPRAKGSASPINKRTAHITVVVAEK